MADLFLSYDDVQALADRLIEQLRGKKFDYFLAIARGGYFPTGILCEYLEQRTIRSASIMYYNGKERLERPVLLDFPPESFLHQKRGLVIDDVWHTGHTLWLAKHIIDRAGGQAEVATLHFKPEQSEVDGRPDYCAAETEDWIHYPWEPRKK